MFKPKEGLSRNTCPSCNSIIDAKKVKYMVDLARHAPDRTPWTYLTISQLHSRIVKLSARNNELKLAGLNTARRLNSSVAKIDVHNRLIHLIANEDISQIRTIITVALRQHRSVTRFWHDCGAPQTICTDQKVSRQTRSILHEWLCVSEVPNLPTV